MIDYIEAIRDESALFAQLVETAAPDSVVPSCPGWSVADLTWHLAEVQYFWASIVENLLESPEDVVELQRPPDVELLDLFTQQSAQLLVTLQSHQPAEVCWSWHDAGHSVGWVLRRQAHEALIHRVDAALAAGSSVAVDTALAADGVDEVLRVMIDASSIPEWSSFVPDGTTASIITDDGQSWALELGRFGGTSPTSGTTYDDPALRLRDPIEQPSISIHGTSADLDLWLWGRGSTESLRIRGDAALVAMIRGAASAGTQ